MFDWSKGMPAKEGGSQTAHAEGEVVLGLQIRVAPAWKAERIPGRKCDVKRWGVMEGEGYGGGVDEISVVKAVVRELGPKGLE